MRRSGGPYSLPNISSNPRRFCGGLPIEAQRGISLLVAWWLPAGNLFSRSVAASSEDLRLPRCPHCREPLGAYEPIVMVRDDEIIRTSRAAAVDLSSGPCYHERCFEQRLSADD
jgi:hypothetical protein